MKDILKQIKQELINLPKRTISTQWGTYEGKEKLVIKMYDDFVLVRTEKYTYIFNNPSISCWGCERLLIDNLKIDFKTYNDCFEVYSKMSEIFV